MREFLLVIMALGVAGCGAWLLYSLANAAWHRRAERMQTDAEWWDTFQKRVNGR